MVTRQAAEVLRPRALSATEGEPRLSPIPTTVREALADPNWRRAMEEEYGALLANQNWDLVSRPSGCNVVTGKWIWTIKRRVDGTLERYKARWVLRGFTQCPSVDYDEASWLRQLLVELHSPLIKSTLVYCDNVSVVYLSTNPVQHQWTKHVEIDLHFVRGRGAIGDVRVLHVPTTSQFANIFT
jgi:hypothetical protein